MKPHEPINRAKQEQKRRVKTNSDKKPIQKRKKGNKTLSQKS
jgi:hypothetical protein